jgi:hypothetical protein
VEITALAWGAASEHVNLVGDTVSGGLHPELLKTDELEVIPRRSRLSIGSSPG